MFFVIFLYIEFLVHIAHHNQLFFTVVQEHSYVIFHLRLPLSSFNSFSRRKTRSKLIYFPSCFTAKPYKKHSLV